MLGGATIKTQSENMSDFISPASQITELESGLSTVRFDGDSADEQEAEEASGGRAAGGNAILHGMREQTYERLQD